ncbi:molybdenum cofactor guanylyltransferase MobA [Sulfurimonas sp. HSL-1716]|uniref:molybdenum cofactor guanylyltransferase MobA n=1 Tax=Hydrocurvibacter sulfurireducens TaxID=3131937 RepID=UPI0031F9723F
MTDIPCVIFAGGKSSRMGEDKALLPFGGYPTLIQFQYERLKKIFTNLYISCKSSDKFDFLKENEKANLIEDIKTDGIYAPTTGFVALFDALHTQQVFILSVDAPFVGKTEIEEILKHKDEGFDAVIAKTPQGIHPMCGLYSKNLHADFKAMLTNNEHKLGKLLKDSHTLYVDFKDEETFLNLNNKNEYAAALKILR